MVGNALLFNNFDLIFSHYYQHLISTIGIDKYSLQCHFLHEIKKRLNNIVVEIFLGVAIGLSLSILILILITIYCCERYRKHRKFGLLHRMLGAPQADHGVYVDDLDEYRKPDESWDRFNYSR